VNVRKILDSYRMAIRDTKVPYFVEDLDAIIYLNEAENEAARRASLLVDSTSPEVIYSVFAGDSVVQISSKIISIRRMILTSSSVPLKKRLAREMDEFAPGWSNSTNTSTPTSAVMDYESNSVFLYPKPDADNELRMTVVREPLIYMTNDANVPEIPARYHFSLIEWMKYRTFSEEDSDMFDQKLAEIALARFEKEFGEGRGAINERFEFEHYDDVGEF